MKNSKRRKIDYNSIFIAVSLLLLIWGMTHLARIAAKELREFTADCHAIGGEVAKQKSRVICIDPNKVLKEMHDEHSHH